MTHDTTLVIGIAITCILVTSLFWILYGTHKADQMRRIHAKEVEALKAEIGGVHGLVRIEDWRSSSSPPKLFEDRIDG